MASQCFLKAVPGSLLLLLHVLPPKALEVYKLPDQVASKVQEQYERDVARVHGGGVVSMDAEYKSFLQELGGGPPPELMGLDPSGETHQGTTREGGQLPASSRWYAYLCVHAYGR